MAVYPRKRARTALKLRQNAFQNIPVILFFDEQTFVFAKIKFKIFSFMLFLVDFGGATLFLTLRARSSANFALDTLFLRLYDEKRSRSRSRLVKLLVKKIVNIFCHDRYVLSW